MVVAAEIAALGLESRDVAHPGARVDNVAWVILEFAQPVIDEFKLEIGADQRDAVSHVLENLLQHGAAAHRIEA